MRHSELLACFTKLNMKAPKQREIAEALQCDIGKIGKRATRDSEYTTAELILLEKAFEIDLLGAVKGSGNYVSSRVQGTNEENAVKVLYRPEVRFSAGYGIEVYDETTSEYLLLDERLFITSRGTKINPNKCEILTISGNSMYPEWKDGDRFILDKSVTEFIDGQIFAFKHNGECYIKEICLLGKRAKAIPLNKEYDEFYIEPDDELVIFGRVVPRVRL